jgi:hypothetical protein
VVAAMEPTAMVKMVKQIPEVVAVVATTEAVKPKALVMGDLVLLY